MTPQSAKAKGKRLQNWFRDQLIEIVGVHPEDVESRSMGARGEDIILSRSARELFPFSVECKAQESVNVWASYQQASVNSGKWEPLLVIARNHTKPKVVLDAEFFLRLVRKTFDKTP